MIFPYIRAALTGPERDLASDAQVACSERDLGTAKGKFAPSYL
jgi:hypothetical protein